MNNKFKIIEVSDYILAVSDEEIKKDDWYYSAIHNNIFQCTHNEQYFEGEKRVIAYQPKNNAPELDLPLLSEMIIEDGVEKLALECIGGWIENEEDNLIYKGFIEGYKAATKVYSEEDMMKAINFIPYHLAYGNITARKSDAEVEEFIQSLKQHKTPFVYLYKTTTINGKTYLYE